ncbi:MAG: hypothetical protein ACOC8P_02165 [Dichotomicrobium sp.]
MSEFSSMGIFTRACRSMKKSKQDQDGAKTAVVQVVADPLLVIMKGLRSQEHLCDCLEQIADSLPDNIDPSLVAATLHLMEHDLALCILDDEDGLFPLLESHSVPGDNVAELLLDLRRGNAMDECYAAEVVEELQNLARDPKPDRPDALGYLLRAFFETRRRHIAWEKAVVMPLARERLDAEAQRVLAARMLRHRDQHVDLQGG